MKKQSSLTIAITVIAIILASIYFVSLGNSSSITNISPAELNAVLEKDPSIQIVDVRTKEEYESGHIAGAINLDWESPSAFNAGLETLTKEKPYALYCRSGRRSAEAAKYMESRGYTQIYNILGGTSSGKLTLENTVQKTESQDGIQSALDAALLDEMHAKTFYLEVLKKYPNERPFSMIVQSEQKHIDALLSLYATYNLTIPNTTNVHVDEWVGTKSEACKIGVQAEIDNAKLYSENLIPKVAGHSDIEVVFKNLMNASQTNHLPAFTRCS